MKLTSSQLQRVLMDCLYFDKRQEIGIIYHSIQLFETVHNVEEKRMILLRV